MADLKKLAADAEAKARRLAAEFNARADQSEVDKVKAETARIIIEIAEKMAPMMWKDDANELLRGIRDMGDELEEVILTEVAAGRSVQEAVQHAVAILDVKHRETQEYLDGNALEAWLKACRDLETL